MDFCKIIAYIMHCLIHAFVLSEKSAFVLRGNISVTITECLYYSSLKSEPSIGLTCADFHRGIVELALSDHLERIE